jgi:1-acyl-sn-glycerol-3-phosphate acyltransferase
MKVLGWVFVQIVKFLGWILLKVEVAGLEHIPETGPVILALNHVNFLDAILYTLIPRETRALAKKETWHNPILYLMATAWEGIPVDRGELDLNAIRLSLQALREGKVLAIAVEGTRSHHGRLQRGRPGIALLASRVPDAPIVPTAIQGGEHFYHNFWRLRRTKLKVDFGPGFHLNPVEGRTTREVRQEIADEIMMQIAALLPPGNRGWYADLDAATEHYLCFPAGVTSSLRRAQGQLVSQAR